MNYSDIKTFDDLYLYGSLYACDRVKKFPIWRDLKEDEKSLYEMVDDYELIGIIIHSYNLLGFFTNMSQPGTRI